MGHSDVRCIWEILGFGAVSDDVKVSVERNEPAVGRIRGHEYAPRARPVKRRETQRVAVIAAGRQPKLSSTARSIFARMNSGV